MKRQGTQYNLKTNKTVNHKRNLSQTARIMSNTFQIHHNKTLLQA